MDGFAIWQQDNAKVPIVHIWHLAPAFDAPICLRPPTAPDKIGR